MGLGSRLLRQPQTLWLRKAAFQIHLWVGLFLAVYVALIGLTGSILVFRAELEAWSRPPELRGAWNGPVNIDPATAIANVTKARPGAIVGFLYAPRLNVPAYAALVAAKGGADTVYVHPETGAIQGSESAGAHGFLRLVGQFHFFLLLGRPGLLANGVGSLLLLALTLTGIVIWWPGIRAWKRGLVVDFSLSWKRINYDLHNVTGFWTLGIVSFWAISGVYFAWPKEFAAVLERFSPLSAPQKQFAIAPGATGKADIAAVLAQARALCPGTMFYAISIPPAAKTPILVYMARHKSGGALEADYVYFDPHTGKHLGTWQRGLTRTASDWIVWSMLPFHTGTRWGFAVKTLWFLLGLSFPLLAVTGVWMYWNRYLSSRWKQLTGNKQRHDLQAELSR